MISNEKCPVCSEINKGLILKGTDGWFICQKCGSDVNNYTEGLAPSRIPVYTMTQLAQKFKQEKDKHVVTAG